MSKLPLDYENYVFDLYGTLVDIHTDEEPVSIWEKLAMFYGYYGAHYSAKELKCRYKKLVDNHEKKLKTDLENSTAYSHEASPEIKIEEVFMQLFTDKGIKADNELAVHAGQFMRVMSTDYVRAYPGTGDLFSAVLLGALLKGLPLRKAAEAAHRFVAHCIQKSDAAGYDTREGVLLEPELLELVKFVS